MKDALRAPSCGTTSTAAETLLGAAGAARRWITLSIRSGRFTMQMLIARSTVLSYHRRDLRCLQHLRKAMHHRHGKGPPSPAPWQTGSAKTTSTLAPSTPRSSAQQESLLRTAAPLAPSCGMVRRASRRKQRAAAAVSVARLTRRATTGSSIEPTSAPSRRQSGAGRLW